MESLIDYITDNLPELPTIIEEVAGGACVICAEAIEYLYDVTNMCCVKHQLEVPFFHKCADYRNNPLLFKDKWNMMNMVVIYLTVVLMAALGSVYLILARQKKGYQPNKGRLNRDKPPRGEPPKGWARKIIKDDGSSYRK